ncbi:MAG TPA: hypothetical protein VKB59_19450 [Micromonosporaceae bacterium]|nr:hypothetical protein [Micromonosporaceae bacterium]
MTNPLDAHNGKRRCKQCGEIKPLEDFVRDQHSRGGYRPRCALCEIKNRTEDKRDRRERHKARTTRARHARKFDIAIDELEDHYGWTLDAIEAAIICCYINGCPPSDDGETCGQPVRNLDDVTVDIIDPTQPPFWGVNTRVICATCNRKKGRRSVLQRQIEEAERQAIARRKVAPRQLNLFEGFVSEEGR